MPRNLKTLKTHPQIPHPHVVSKLLLDGAEGQESKCISSFRRMNAHNLFTFYLQSSKQLQPLVLFKCFSTPENAARTAVAELVIRNVFWSKQPLGLSLRYPTVGSTHC